MLRREVMAESRARLEDLARWGGYCSPACQSSDWVRSHCARCATRDRLWREVVTKADRDRYRGGTWLALMVVFVAVAGAGGLGALVYGAALLVGAL